MPCMSQPSKQTVCTTRDKAHLQTALVSVLLHICLYSVSLLQTLFVFVLIMSFFPAESFCCCTNWCLMSPRRSIKKISYLRKSHLNHILVMVVTTKCHSLRLRQYFWHFYSWDYCHSKIACQFTDEKQHSQWHLTGSSVTLTTAVWTGFNGSLLDHRLLKGHDTHLIWHRQGHDTDTDKFS